MLKFKSTRSHFNWDEFVVSNDDITWMPIGLFNHIGFHGQPNQGAFFIIKSTDDFRISIFDDFKNRTTGGEKN